VISSLRGTVLALRGASVMIDVGGVGYAVHVTPHHAMLLREDEPIFVFTMLVVRDDSLTLFGFKTSEELEVFELLIGVTGVGPKSALGVLSALTPTEIARAVANEDDAAFRSVSGVGPKTAKLIVLSLSGKLDSLRALPPASPAVYPQSRNSVLIALVGLGWSERHAERALQEIFADDPTHSSLDVQALLRLALVRLGPTHKENVQT